MFCHSDHWRIQVGARDARPPLGLFFSTYAVFSKTMANIIHWHNPSGKSWIRYWWCSANHNICTCMISKVLDTSPKQECIPVGCVRRASMVISTGVCLGAVSGRGCVSRGGAVCQGGVSRVCVYRGCLPKEFVCSGGCLPREVSRGVNPLPIACWDTHPLWTDRRLWKYFVTPNFVCER